MPLYRTLIENLEGKELLREYKPHSRTIYFPMQGSDEIIIKNYHLPLPYVLFFQKNFNFCVAFAKEPMVNFDSKIYAPMFSNVYEYDEEDEEEDDYEYYNKPIYRVCMNTKGTLQKSIEEFWSSNFGHDGDVAYSAMERNFLLANFKNIKTGYEHWEKLNSKQVMDCLQSEMSLRQWTDFYNRGNLLFHNGFGKE
jgi:hypothetical protein